MKNTQEKGITLVALVITIVILLILAGVSLSTVLGDNGVLKESKKIRENEIQKMEKTEESKEKLQNELTQKLNIQNGI